MIQRYDLGTIANTGQKTMYKEEHGRFVRYDDHLAELSALHNMNPCGHTGAESFVCDICGYPDPRKLISSLWEDFKGICKKADDYERDKELAAEIIEKKDAEIADLKDALSNQMFVAGELREYLDNAKARIDELEYDLDTITVKDSELFQRLELKGRIKELEEQIKHDHSVKVVYELGLRIKELEAALKQFTDFILEECCDDWKCEERGRVCNAARNARAALKEKS